MKPLNKKKSSAFNKDCYLIGKDKHGDYIWLEAAQWTCGWYWGFGYIEVYTNQLNPEKARDISSHSHFNGLIGKQEDGEYKHHINEVLVESVLSDSESWELADLMSSFYTLQDAAALLKLGSSYIASSAVSNDLKNDGMRKEINEVLMPAIINRVYAILDPDTIEVAA